MSDVHQRGPLSVECLLDACKRASTVTLCVCAVYLTFREVIFSLRFHSANRYKYGTVVLSVLSVCL